MSYLNIRTDESFTIFIISYFYDRLYIYFECAQAGDTKPRCFNGKDFAECNENCPGGVIC